MLVTLRIRGEWFSTKTKGQAPLQSLLSNSREGDLYMKKLLLIALTTTSFVSLAQAATTEELAKRVTDFITMEQGHKSKWFDVENDMHKAKMDLVKKHMVEHTDLAKRKITELGKTKNVDAYLESKLAESIALHKKQMEEWKAFSNAWVEKKRAQGQKEMSELAEFEGSEEEPTSESEIELIEVEE